MEKKFKNESFAIKGPKTLLNAFVEELKLLGYSFSSNDNATFNKLFLAVYPTSCTSQYLNHDGSHIVYTLPQDWDKVLQLASEVEEVVPEYVECVKDGLSSFTKGKIYKTKGWVEGISDYYAVECDDGGSSSNSHHKKWFKPSTREAYEAQQNAPKYKVGDFIKMEECGENLSSVKEIVGKNMRLEQEIGGNGEPINFPSSPYPIDSNYTIVSDEEALEMLKKAYASKGIVEGAKVLWGFDGGEPETVQQIKLRKNVTLWRFRDEASHFEHGNSQLAISCDSPGNYIQVWITPTTSNFKVLPKEVKVAGYTTSINKGPIGSEKLIKVGCKSFTYDSLITIRDLIIHGIQEGGHTMAYFKLSGVGNIKVTVDELNQAIELFDR